MPMPVEAEFVSVDFQPEGKKVRLARGASLLEAAAQAGLRLQSACGGQGACGKCRIILVSPAPAPTEADRRRLSEQELAQGVRLACQVRPTGDTVVEIPAASRMIRERISLEGIGRQAEVEPALHKVFVQMPPPSLADQRADLARVLAALGGNIRPPRELRVVQELPGRLRQAEFKVTAVLADGELLEVEPGDTTAQLYGLAFDIGTTTIVGYLCHLESGAQVAVGSTINPQVQFGDDVVSRISFASSSEAGLARLQQEVVEAINGIIAETCREAGIDRRWIYEIVVVGNTCMSHLLLGISPASLATLPYVPVNTAPRTLAARELGVQINPCGRIYLLPNIAGFVGADTVGVIIASGLEERRGLRVAVDIGTNGEVVVAKAGRMICCSTAAGPAFEGARISQGMRAASGAIDQVSLVRGGGETAPFGELQIHTVDGTPARGICGSGLVDAVAALVEAGIVTTTGRMLDAGQAPDRAGSLRERLELHDGLPRFVLVKGAESATGEPIWITSKDVRELQLAKAAICAGVLLLLQEMGAEPHEIEELLLAGAFGNYIRRESALAIGLLPALPLARVKPIGNAAGLGARLALLSTKMRRLAEEAAKCVEYVELSERAQFYQYFTDAMQLAPISGPNRPDN